MRAMIDDGLNKMCPGCSRQFESGSLARVMPDPPAVLCWRCVSGRYERGDIGADVEVSVSPLTIHKAIFAIDELISSILALNSKEDG